MATAPKKMSNGRNRCHSSLPDLEQSKDTMAQERTSNTAAPFIQLLSRLFKKIHVATWVTGMLGRLRGLAFQMSRGMKRNTAIAALVTAAILAGHTVSAQVSLPPLSSVKVPEPDNIGDFIRDKTAAVALGKSLFWDMQLGVDGIQSCASCHFHAGVDSRSKNQLNPGLRAGDTVFDIGGRPNYQLTAADFPFHKLANPNIRAVENGNLISDKNDVTGSQGVFRSEFVDVVPGSDKDNVTPLKDDVFNVQGTNVRRVTGRHTPSTINAVFNFRNFWDGRAQNIFNGVNEFGLRDSNAFILTATNPRRLEDVRVTLKNSSLASQAVGPPLDAFETFAENPPIAPFAPLRISDSETNNTISVSAINSNEVAELDADDGQTIRGSANLLRSTDEVSADNLTGNDANLSRRRPTQSLPRTPFTRRGRKLGKKLLALQPLAKQVVANDDSVLGPLSNSTSNSPQKGLKKSYEQMIRDAFQPQWWNSNFIIRIDPSTGERRFYRRSRNRPLSTIEYTLMEYNFSLFFGLAVQAYESTLISEQTPFDQFLAGNTSALTAQQQTGWNIFQNRGLCIGCHAGSELTSASVSSVASRGRIVRAPVPGNPAEDTGFFRIGVRPQEEDPGVGGVDNSGNSLSETRLAQQGLFKQLLGEDPPTLNPPLNPNENAIAEGAFKAPGLRNIELTAPYFHNGGQLTLRQVVDFYSRGGDFGGLPVLNLSDAEKEALVAFLQGLTDERVRFQRAPFDHPQLFVPNGHPGDQNAVVIDPNVKTNDGTTQATDALLEIPAIGRNGGNPLSNFLSTY